MKIGITRPYNAYGPRDDFEQATSHVIPALIRKVVENHNPLIVWGDGQQTRSFLYAKDFAKGLIAVLEHYPMCDPVNLGSDQEISIADLVPLIQDVAGVRAEVVFDTSRPSGQPRRNGDFTKARERCGFIAQTALRDGLAETIDWYRRQQVLA